ncbi:hypothetical protein V8F06_007144 [Rhypophila decipiens]
MSAVSVASPLIGNASGILTIIGFILGLFPSRPPSNVVTVRICAGLNHNGNEYGSIPMTGADGGISRVKVYNENEQLIGNIGGAYIGTGQYRDFQISQPNNQQATWMSMAGDGNPICVSYATTQWVDGSKYGWSGDWGRACNWEWHYGNVYVGSMEGGAANYKPRCAWMSTNHDTGFQVGMYKIHWPSFVRSKPHGNTVYGYCPKSGAYRDPFKVRRGAVDGNGTEIIIPSRRNQTDDRLIVSSDPAQSARELCESPSSWGPDFVSLTERLYCNMATSELIPLCGSGEDSSGDRCFRLDLAEEEGARKAHVRRRDGTISVKHFGDVLRWDLEVEGQMAVPAPDPEAGI